MPASAEGEKRYDYGKVIAIFMGCVYVYVIILTFVGPEHLRRKFDVVHDQDARAVVGDERMDYEQARRMKEDDRKLSDVEKPSNKHIA